MLRVDRVLLVLLLVLFGAAAPAQAGDDKWRGSANLYAWVSDTDVSVRVPTGTETISIKALDAFKHVEFTIMGGGSISRGRVGVAADLLYARLNATDIGLPSDNGLEVDLGFRARTLVLTLAPFYTLVDLEQFRLRGFVGTRHLDLRQTVDFTISGTLGALPLPDISGSLGTSVSNWDAIVGFAGEWHPRPRGLFVPFAIDIGGGASERTWQYVVGVGYRLPWGDITLAYRDLRYDLSGEIAQLRLHGPAIGAAVRF